MTTIIRIVSDSNGEPLSQQSRMAGIRCENNGVRVRHVGGSIVIGGNKCQHRLYRTAIVDRQEFGTVLGRRMANICSHIERERVNHISRQCITEYGTRRCGVRPGIWWFPGITTHGLATVRCCKSPVGHVSEADVTRVPNCRPAGRVCVFSRRDVRTLEALGKDDRRGRRRGREAEDGHCHS